MENAINEYRKKYGYTFRQMSDMCGISKTPIYRHCLNLQKISAESAMIYSNTFGIPLHELRPDLWEPPTDEAEK